MVLCGRPVGRFEPFFWHSSLPRGNERRRWLCEAAREAGGCSQALPCRLIFGHTKPVQSHVRKSKIDRPASRPRSHRCGGNFALHSLSYIPHDRHNDLSRKKERGTSPIPPNTYHLHHCLKAATLLFGSFGGRRRLWRRSLCERARAGRRRLVCPLLLRALESRTFRDTKHAGPASFSTARCCASRGRRGARCTMMRGDANDEARPRCFHFLEVDRASRQFVPHTVAPSSS